MTKEQKFYKALEDLFIGAKIEGEGGFVNLMRIKSSYYSKIREYLEKDVNIALEKYPKFREELFDKLYSFFSRYFTKSGSIYFNYTPFFQNVYDKVYTDDKDVILFWKTRMLYYVKTDRILKNLKVELEEKDKKYNFFFDVSNLEYKKANEKKSLIYEFKKIQQDGTIVFNVFYAQGNKKTNFDDIKKQLKSKGIIIADEILEKTFSTFEAQSEVDYFINKNAKEFLQEQFKLWLFQYVYSEETEWPKQRIDELQILKDIAFKIIDFISQFEDELVKIWNKPKFVFNSNYVITLDRIAKQNGWEIIEKLIKHKNFKDQVKEWQELGIIDKEPKELIEKTLTGKQLKKEYEHLPIDTKYFKDLETEILSLFDDLDRSLDGWLIKSENYQALNTILPKFKEKVQTIYIDPPFNKENEADYLYKVGYKDATWITMLENRIRLARELLNEKGSIFVRCDYNGNMYVRLLMNEIFGKENFRNEITIAKSKEFFKTMTHIKKFSEETESLFLFSKTENMLFNLIYKEKDKPSKYEPFLPVDDKLYSDFRIINGEKVFSPKGRKWGVKQEDIEKLINEKRLVYENGKWWLITYQEPLKDVWIDYQGYSRNWGFKTENSEILLKRVIESTSNEGDLVMDFFLGSGTTTAVAHKLGRKWIGIEMGEHFYSVVLPRMKKVLAYDKSGISKEVKEYQGGGFFKYYELEQYEDVLRKAKYEDSTLFDIPGESPYQQYVFLKDKKLLEAIEIDYKNNKVKVDFSKIYSKEKDGKEIDIAETLSNLKGKWIKRITKNEVEFEDGEKVDLNNLDWKEIKSLIWW